MVFNSQFVRSIVVLLFDLRTSNSAYNLSMSMNNWVILSIGESNSSNDEFLEALKIDQRGIEKAPFDIFGRLRDLVNLTVPGGIEKEF